MEEGAGLCGLSWGLTDALENLTLYSHALVLHMGSTDLRVWEKCFAWCIKKMLQNIATFTVKVSGGRHF